MEQGPERDPRAFIEGLRGKRFGLVYSHRFKGSLEDAWYHRWRTNVIALFSFAVEVLDGIPIFFNIDQFIEHFGNYDRPTNIDYVVNLNAGNRFLDNWALAPALGRWRNVPVFPCEALTVLLGERKDTSKILAEAFGWRVATPAERLVDPDTLIVEKPLTFGSSVGLERFRQQDYRALGHRSGVLAEAFVPGYDATIVVLYSLFLQAPVCLGAMVHVPDRLRPEDWMYDAFEKRNPGVRTKVEQRFCQVDAELADKSVQLASAFHSTGVARIDVRLDRAPENTDPIGFSQCTFLEINPMPTIGPDSSVTTFAARVVEEHRSDPILASIVEATSDPIHRAAAYILAAGLFACVGI
jgi:hypothetical protein